jgi:hypothetical protein
MLEAADMEVMVGDPIPLIPLLYLLIVLKHGDFIIMLERDVLPLWLF